MKRENSLLRQSLGNIVSLAVPLALVAFGVSTNCSGRAEALSKPNQITQAREYNLKDFEKRQAEREAAEQEKKVLNELETRLDKLELTRTKVEPRASIPNLETTSQSQDIQANQAQALFVKKSYAECPEFPNQIYQERFEKFKDIFEKYGSNPPKGMNETDYTALLAAIAERESSMGYPRGSKEKYENALTGYASGKRNNRNAEDQITATSKTLKDALDGNHPYYPQAGCLEGKERILYVLEVYNMGHNATGKNKEQAQRYARDVYSKAKKWGNLFTAD